MRLPFTPRRLGHDGGSAAIEFALFAPFLTATLIAVIEIGLAIHGSIRTQAAADIGAAWAVGHGYSAAGISSAILSGSDASGLTVSPAPVLACGCPTATGVTAAACGTNCSNGVAARQYVTVSASLLRTSIFASGLPLPTTLTRQTVARLP